MSKKSNIEKWQSSADAQTLHTAKVSGAYASHAARTAKRAVNDKLNALMRTASVPELVSGLLMNELTDEQRKAVRDIVPERIMDEEITPLIAMVYAAIDKTIRNGDAGQLEKLLRLAGETAELKVKLNVESELDPEKIFDVQSMSDEELYAVIAQYEKENPDEDSGVIDVDHYEPVH